MQAPISQNTTLPIQNVNCPHCKANMTTVVKREAGIMFYITGILIIPLFLDNFKDWVHYCPKCKQCLHEYHRVNGL